MGSYYFRGAVGHSRPDQTRTGSLVLSAMQSNWTLKMTNVPKIEDSQQVIRRGFFFLSLHDKEAPSALLYRECHFKMTSPLFVLDSQMPHPWQTCLYFTSVPAVQSPVKMFCPLVKLSFIQRSRLSTQQPCELWNTEPGPMPPQSLGNKMSRHWHLLEASQETLMHTEGWKQLFQAKWLFPPQKMWPYTGTIIPKSLQHGMLIIQYRNKFSFSPGSKTPTTLGHWIVPISSWRSTSANEMRSRASQVGGEALS